MISLGYMETFQKGGQGTPEAVILGGIHGDEPVGKTAIEQAISKFKHTKPVEYIIANEKALEKNRRYIDEDLNRAFPGEQKALSHESQLAWKIYNHVNVGKTPVLALHSTRSTSEPFILSNSRTEFFEKIALTLPVRKAVINKEISGTIASYDKVIGVECGEQQSKASHYFGIRVIGYFLAAFGAIDLFTTKTPVDLFIAKGKTVKETQNDIFTKKNFEKIEKGEAYGIQEGRPLTAEENFYPFLMSSNGYENILGYKADKVDTIYPEDLD